MFAIKFKRTIAFDTSVIIALLSMLIVRIVENYNGKIQDESNQNRWVLLPPNP
jgi:hypothetical protein